MVNKLSTLPSSKDKTNRTFRIAGIGASAGGLAAFSQLLKALPETTGLAYVIISHMDPTRKSLLPEILSASTKMQVLEIKDGTKVVPNHVYIIPPNAEMTIHQGVLRLTKRTQKSNPNSSIDYFFTSLAEDQRENAIGIILSGAAADGSRGIKAIKEASGITFAQTEKSAEYPSMPMYAISTGCIDFVLPPVKIAEQLTKIAENVVDSYPKNKEVPRDENDINRVLALLQTRKKIDFSHYKMNTIKRRIDRRMLINQVGDYTKYIQLLKDNRGEEEALYQDLLIGVTSFFRDPERFEHLNRAVFPHIIKSLRSDESIRIWAAGCSTGEEAYSLAICLQEYLEENGLSIPVQIFASDINEKAITKARQGIYPPQIISDVSAKRLNRFFIKEENNYRINKAIRDTCIFANHNLITDPPFSRLNLITCCNVLIYMNQILQNKLLSKFHYGLKPGGLLMLGKSETASNSSFFSTIDKKQRIYSKKDIPSHVDFHYSPANLSKGEESGTIEIVRDTTPTSNVQEEMNNILLSKYAPASIVVSEAMEILEFRGTVGRYLQHPGGKASLNLLKMGPESLLLELRTLIHQVKKNNKPVRKEHISATVDGQKRIFAVEIFPMTSHDLNFLILFEESPSKIALPQEPRPKVPVIPKDKHVAIIEKELAETRKYLHDVIKEQDTFIEEQKATKEILSDNEELQSINEELETSKEEIESMNEELTTVNEELQNRNEQLKKAKDYAEKIFQTVREPLIILDSSLRVISTNISFYEAFDVDMSHTEGELLYNIGNGQWDIPELRRALEQILPKKNHFSNFEMTHTFPQIGTKTMLLNARQIDSQQMILLAIEDITERKHNTEQLNFNNNVLKHIKESVIVTNLKGEIIYWNKGTTELFGYTEKEMIGKTPEILYPESNPQEFREILDQILKGKDYKGDWKGRTKDGKIIWVDILTTALLNPRGEPSGFIGVSKDITHRLAMEKQKDDFINIASHELKTPITSIKAYAQIIHKRLKSNNLDADTSGLLEKMDEQVNSVARLVDDLLNASRIKSGKLELEKKETDVTAFAKKVIDDMQKITTTHVITLEGHVTEPIKMDAYRMQQVLTNLLTNAIKYSPHADKILVRLASEKDKVIISVEDHGIGIPQNQISKIFDSYYRVHHSIVDKNSGLGLGLRIAREIVKQHNGKMWVKSKEGEGSAFFFSIPL